MGWHLPFGRSARAASGVAASHDDGARIAPYDPRPREWARLSPIATVIQQHELTADARFGDGLNARPREFFLQPLGHEVTGDGPQGSITPAQPQSSAPAAGSAAMPLVSQRSTAQRSPLQRLMTAGWSGRTVASAADESDAGDVGVPAVPADEVSAPSSVAAVAPEPTGIGLQRSTRAIESNPPRATSLVSAPSNAWSAVRDASSMISAVGLDGGSKDAVQLPPTTRDAVSLGVPQSVLRSASVQRATLGQSRRLGLGPPLSPSVSSEQRPSGPAVTDSAASLPRTPELAPVDGGSLSKPIAPTYVQALADTATGDRFDPPGLRYQSQERDADPVDAVRPKAGVADGQPLGLPGMVQRAMSATPSVSPPAHTPPKSQRVMEPLTPLSRGQLFVAQRDAADQSEPDGVTESVATPEVRPASQAPVGGEHEPYPPRGAMPAQPPGNGSPGIATTAPARMNVQLAPAASVDPRPRPLLGMTPPLRVSPIRSPLHSLDASPESAFVAQRALESVGVDAAAHDADSTAITTSSSAVSSSSREAAADAVDSASHSALRPSSPFTLKGTPSSRVLQRSAATTANRLVASVHAHGVPDVTSHLALRGPSWERPAASALAAMPAPRATTTVVQRTHEDAPAPSVLAAGTASWAPPNDASTSSFGVQRSSESAWSAPHESQPGAAEGAHAASAPQGGDLDALAHDMYQRIRSELRMELLLDRERAGLVTDLR